MQAFTLLAKDAQTLGGIGLKGGVAIPLLDFIVEIGPPWPS